MTIGVVIRDLAYLKVLQPIIEEFGNRNIPYILYHYDVPRGDKEYNRAKLDSVVKSSSRIVSRAIKVSSFLNDSDLLKKLISDNIKKMVSLEIYLWAKNYISSFKSAKIKLYNILYLSDSIWNNDPRSITAMDRVYYTTSYLRDIHLKFLNIKQDNNRDKILGSPVFDCLTENIGNDILILLPNLKSEHVKTAFGSETKFISIIDKLSKNNNLIFKTRKKQWLPEAIKKFAKEIVDDGDIMYPSKVSEIFKKTNITVLFYSSGIYEAVYAGQYVINIPIPLKRWPWDMNKMKNYFCTEEGNLYQFNGVVESISADKLLSDSWQIKNKLIEENRINWINKYIGKFKNSYKEIANDIIT